MTDKTVDELIDALFGTVMGLIELNEKALAMLGEYGEDNERLCRDNAALRQQVTELLRGQDRPAFMDD